MADLSKIRKGGTDYNLKDSSARASIDAQTRVFHMNGNVDYPASGIVVQSVAKNSLSNGGLDVKTGDILISTNGTVCKVTAVSASTVNYNPIGTISNTGYATEQFVSNGYQPKGEYLESTTLAAAINTALEQAKASGEFKGDPGKDGEDGYTPVKDKDYFDGEDGQDGVSATHSWNGTVLTVTSASGTSSADLKGEKGEKGRDVGVFVTDYGAKGDGSTDDTAAFQTALAENRVLIVPGGDYVLSDTLVIRANCCLELSQDTVLRFTQTNKNAITMLRLANLRGNHATIFVPYGFSANVINCDGGEDYARLDSSNLAATNATAVPPFKKWDPQWKMSRYVTDINICKPKTDGEHNSVDGACSGNAVYVHCDEADWPVNYMWGVDMSGIRIAGAFNYGIRAYNKGAHVDSWNHDMRIEAVIDACKVGVSLENCYYARLQVSIQGRRAADDSVYAEHGIELRDSRGVDLSGSRVWDWDDTNSLWASGNQYQHLALYGECRGLILDDFVYYESSTDIRELIYTNKASNFEQMTILQEPITRWFKVKDGEPYYSNGLTEKRLITEEQLDAHFDTDIVKDFTDVLATATDENGNVLDGKGYTGGYLTGTGALYTEGDSKEYYVTTGFIPCATGQTAYVEGMSYASYDGNCTFCLYDADKKLVHTASATNLVTGTYWYIGYEATENGFTATPKNVVGNEKVAYIRFTVERARCSDFPMIAIDEEIKYTVEGFLADGIKVWASNVVGGSGGSGGSGINVTAEVGQTIVVEAVDELGIPTKWKAVDMPTGGVDVTATVGQTIVVEEVDANGKPTKWSSADYQPRTHWIDERAELANETWTNEGEYFINITLTEGETYYVTFNGVEYACIAGTISDAEMGDAIYIGNSSTVGLDDTGEPFVALYVPSVGVTIGAILDETTEQADVVIRGKEAIPIPVQYVSNAFPYYIDVTGDGSDDNPYVCNDTVKNVRAIYRSGRQLIVRRGYDGGYILYYLVMDNSNEYGTYFGFATTDVLLPECSNHRLLLKEQEDGTFAVADKLI